jgi:hypothetical protein
MPCILCNLEFHYRIHKSTSPVIISLSDNDILIHLKKGNEVGGTCGRHGSGQECVQGFGGKPEGKRPLGRPRMGSEWILGRLAGEV